MIVKFSFWKGHGEIFYITFTQFGLFPPPNEVLKEYIYVLVSHKFQTELFSNLARYSKFVQ